jgi:hypothetical protein
MYINMVPWGEVPYPAFTFRSSVPQPSMGIPLARRGLMSGALCEKHPTHKVTSTVCNVDRGGLDASATRWTLFPMAERTPSRDRPSFVHEGLVVPCFQPEGVVSCGHNGRWLESPMDPTGLSSKMARQGEKRDRYSCEGLPQVLVSVLHPETHVCRIHT